MSVLGCVSMFQGENKEKEKEMLQSSEFQMLLRN